VLNYAVLCLLILSGSYLWYILLLQLITDVNLAVSVEATQAIGNLARGLRAHFSGNSRMLLPVLLVSLFSPSVNIICHQTILLLTYYDIEALHISISLDLVNRTN
jgi:hypothetical protein